MPSYIFGIEKAHTVGNLWGPIATQTKRVQEYPSSRAIHYLPEAEKVFKLWIYGQRIILTRDFLEILKLHQVCYNAFVMMSVTLESILKVHVPVGIFFKFF